MRIASVYESKSSINCIKPFYPINIAKLPPRILGYGIVPEDTSFHLFQLLCADVCMTVPSGKLICPPTGFVILHFEVQ